MKYGKRKKIKFVVFPCTPTKKALACLIRISNFKSYSTVYGPSCKILYQRQRTGTTNVQYRNVMEISMKHFRIKRLITDRIISLSRLSVALSITQHSID